MTIFPLKRPTGKRKGVVNRHGKVFNESLSTLLSPV